MSAVRREGETPSSPRPRFGKRASWAVLAVLAVGVALGLYVKLSFPSDRTPEGAYLRVVIALNRDKPEGCFAYTETAAQHAAFSAFDYQRRALQRIRQAYPEPERGQRAKNYGAAAHAADGPAFFAQLARQRGWVARLRRDLSGVGKVEIDGERATVETVRGTRYPFRQRENGIWGLTLFTAELRAEAEKAARDFELIERAAQDYERARGAAPAPAP